MMPFEGYKTSRILVTRQHGLPIKVARIFTGSRAKLVFKPLPQDDPRQRQPDLAKAKATLDWAPKVALEDGPKETIAHFKHSLEIA